MTYRRLLNAPIIQGNTYRNGISQFTVLELGVGEALVRNVVSGWTCRAHGPALYMVDEDHMELQWDYSTGGYFV